jgi:acyl dehydratase
MIAGHQANDASLGRACAHEGKLARWPGETTMHSTRFSVGDTFRSVRRCDALTPVAYAATSGDFNPIHLDAAVARAAGGARRRDEEPRGGPAARR